MGALIRSMDWSKTPLGPLESWPQSLRTSVSLCLSSTFPILVAWGADDVQIYNDAYRPICGEKHPEAMGAPFRICWATALPVVGDAFDRAHEGEGAYIRDQQMFLDRYGYLEEAFMTFSFSPIRDESGAVGGVFHPITETTAQVLNARRTQSLRDLSTALAGARSIEEIGGHLAAQYKQLETDVPFLLFYQQEAGGQLVLRGHAGLEAGSAMAPLASSVDGGAWPFVEVTKARTALPAEIPSACFADVCCGPYKQAPRTALVLPVVLPGQQELFGFVVAGVSACRELDAAYMNFYELLGAAMNTAVGNVVAYEQELRRAEELAQIDRAKTAFFSNVSHEFRTPLTLILGPLEDALADRDETLPPGQHTRIAVTHRNALRLLKLVNSLLDFSRIEAGRVQASYAPSDLTRITADLASVFESAMAKGGLDYVIQLQDLGEPVYIDRDMWEKIVFNLLSNAFKYTLEGRVTVTLARHAGMARLSVRDTGCGIAEHELPRVFERFHRIEGMPGRTYEGTGIGLALIQELVRLHGGAIAVHSTEGAGSTFEIDLPFGREHLPAERIAQTSEQQNARNGAAYVEEALRWLPDTPAGAPSVQQAADDEPRAVGRPRIVVADDNNDMRAYVKSLLDAEADVIACADGEAAFAELLRDPPDLLLSDVMMPRLDGFGLLARIRAHDTLRHLPVMLLSARAGEEAKVEGLQAGADDYLVKPFAANELIARVRRQVALAQERQQQRRQAELQEGYFRTLVDASPVMLWTTNRDGFCTYLSQRWYDFTGRTPEQDLGLGWLDNVHPEDAPQTRAAIAAAMAANTPFAIDYRLRQHDGAYRWAIDAGMPRFDAAGEPIGFVGTVIDIHARKTLQQRFERVAHAADIGVWYADAPFDSFNLNAQMAVHLGDGEQRQVPLERLLALARASDRDRLSNAVRQALTDGAALDIEFLTSDAAQPRWLRAVGWCELKEDGTPLRFDGVTLDITGHKTAELEQQRLTDEVTTKNRMQSDFLFTLAHELRNPLAPIRTGLELMRVNANAGARRDLRDMMERQVEHIVHLVDDLLDMARLTQGKLTLRSDDVELAQVVQDALEMSMPLVTSRQHEMSVQLPEHPVLLHVDRHRIAQVFSNLINNAAKYTPPGGALRFEARLEQTAVVVTVTDNGVGMAPELLAAAFELYTQAPAARDVAGGGLGVGLNLVRRLVELHGGSVRADSDGMGRGSTFTVTLPLPDGGAAQSAPAAPQALAAPAPGLRVLVVDDNQDAADTLAAILDIYGHQTMLATDGASALALAPQFQPQAVCLDIGLPGMDGYQVARALRDIEGLADVFLIALTGWGTEQDRQRSQQAGFDHHLTKPVDFAVLKEVLANAG